MSVFKQIGLIFILILLQTSCSMQSENGELPNVDNSESQSHKENSNSSEEKNVIPQPTDFEINDTMFLDSYTQVLELIMADGQENNSFFPPIFKGNEVFNHEKIILPDELEMPTCVGREGDLLYILDTQEELQDVFAYDLKTLDLTPLGLEIENNFTISEFHLFDQCIYWIESNYHNPDPYLHWNFHVYHLNNKEQILLDSSGNYSNATFVPRLSIHNGNIAYLIGEEKEENLNHTVMLYKNDELSHVFTIQNVVDPFTPVFLSEKYLAYPEHYEDGWALLSYHLEEDELSIHSLEFLVEHEFPRAVFLLDEVLIYKSSTDLWYIKETKTGNVHLIASTTEGGQYLDGFFSYTNGGDVWAYDIKNNTNILISENTDNHQNHITRVQLQNNAMTGISFDIEKEIYYFHEFSC